MKERRWTKSEEADLLAAWNAGVSSAGLAAIHDRELGDVEQKLMRHLRCDAAMLLSISDEMSDFSPETWNKILDRKGKSFAGIMVKAIAEQEDSKVSKTPETDALREEYRLAIAGAAEAIGMVLPDAFQLIMKRVLDYTARMERERNHVIAQRDNAALVTGTITTSGSVRRESMPSYPKFKVRQRVSKQGGDYQFDGVVVAAFRKLSGKTRYVVEDDRGVLHIYQDSNLKAFEPLADTQKVALTQAPVSDYPGAGERRKGERRSTDSYFILPLADRRGQWPLGRRVSDRGTRKF